MDFEKIVLDVGANSSSEASSLARSLTHWFHSARGFDRSYYENTHTLVYFKPEIILLFVHLSLLNCAAMMQPH